MKQELGKSKNADKWRREMGMRKEEREGILLC